MQLTTNTKIVLGLAGVAAVTAAVVFYPKKASAGQGGPGGPGGPAPITKDSGEDLIAACVDGTKEGNLDGGKDGSLKSSKSPSPRMNYSSITTVQAKFEECYQIAYGKAFDVAKAAKEIAKTTTFSMPSAGEMSAAKASGRSSGYAQGQLDASSGHSYLLDYSRVPAGYRTQPANAALAKQWQDGYAEGYGDAFASSSGIDMFSSGGGDGRSVGRAYVRVSGRMVPAERVGAMALPTPKRSTQEDDPKKLLIAIRPNPPTQKTTYYGHAVNAVKMPFSMAAKISSGFYNRAESVINHVRTRGVVGGALTARAYFG